MLIYQIKYKYKNILKYYLVFLFIQFSFSSYADSLNRILKNKEIIIGSDGSCLPYELRTPEGKWVGFEVDLMRAFAKYLHVNAKFVDYGWDGLVPALLSNKFDIIASDIAITEEKKNIVLFTNPYYKVGVRAIYLKENTKIFVDKNIEQMNIVGLKIGVQLGTSASLMAKKYFPKANIIIFQNQDIASQALLFKKIDILYYEENYLKQFTKRNAQRVVFLPGKMGEFYLAAAARKEDSLLINKFNEFYNEWKMTKDFQNSYRINFEIMPWVR